MPYKLSNNALKISETYSFQKNPTFKYNSAFKKWPKTPIPNVLYALQINENTLKY